MPTHIKQIDDPARNRTILRVEGDMYKEDALLLEKIAHDMRNETGKRMTLDLADLHFLDSDSASILKKLEREDGFELEGLEIFLQRAVTESEK